MKPEARTIGLVGTGFIARGFARLIARSHPDLRIAAVLTRRDPASVEFPVREALTQSIGQLLEKSELVVECSGDPIHATEVIDQALAAGLPVVTMNSEFHVTSGSHFVGRGYLTEAEGDQPGCLAALRDEALAMGFTPLAYVNLKGFQNLTPGEDDMKHWADRQDFSVQQTTSFTDGTKLQIEQAFVANGCGATLIERAMIGSAEPDLKKVAAALGMAADRIGGSIVDYAIHSGHPPGVLVVARHDDAERIPLRTIKMGEGPYYTLMRNHHLCALEMAKTVKRALAGAPILLDNGRAPAVGVAAVAKRDLAAGTPIPIGIGGFDVRGEAVLTAEAPSHVPIGLLRGARLRRSVQAGQTLAFADVDLPDSLAVRLCGGLHPATHPPAGR